MQTSAIMSFFFPLRPRYRLLLLALLMMCVALPAYAQQPSSPSFRLSSSVFGAGGADAQSGSFRHQGTLGETLTGPSQSPTFRQGSGFWYTVVQSITTPTNQPPAITSLSGDINGTEGSAFAFTAAASDPDGNPLTYTWAFGDGTPGEAGVDLASVTHIYATAGSYTLTLTVSDGLGGNASETLAITVTPASSNQPPVIASLSGDTNGTEGTAFAFTAAATDPDGDPLTYTWAFGDGTPDEAGIDLSGVTHIYATAGSYTLTLTVKDGQGGSSTETLPLTVTPAQSGIPLAAVPRVSEAVSGETFAVDIVVGTAQNPVANLFGVGFQLSFDPALFTVLATELGGSTFLEDGIPAGSLVLFEELENTNGTVSFSVSRKNGAAGRSGTGTVVTLQFQVKPNASLTTATMTLSNILAVDPQGASIGLIPIDGSIDIVNRFVVWPGDTDANGLAEAADLLPIGFNFGLTGPARPNADFSWTAQETDPWDVPPGTPANTPNLAHADATGDGVINQNDVLPLGLNFGEVHTAAAAKSGNADSTLARLLLPPQAVGTTYHVLIDLGQNGQPLQDLFGIATRLAVPADVLHVRDVTAGPLLDNGDLLSFSQYDPATGLLEAAFTRKRGSAPASGTGTALSLTLEVMTTMAHPADIQIADLRLSNSQGNIRGVSANEVTLSQETTATSLDATRVIPTTFALEPAYPNPFNPQTTLAYQLPQAEHVRLVVYDVQGRQVSLLVNDRQPAGRYTVTFEAGDLPSGLYLYRLEAGSFAKTAKMMLVK